MSNQQIAIEEKFSLRAFFKNLGNILALTEEMQDESRDIKPEEANYYNVSADEMKTLQKSLNGGRIGELEKAVSTPIYVEEKRIKNNRKKLQVKQVNEEPRKKDVNVKTEKSVEELTEKDEKII